MAKETTTVQNEIPGMIKGWELWRGVTAVYIQRCRHVATRKKLMPQDCRKTRSIVRVVA